MYASTRSSWYSELCEREVGGLKRKSDLTCRILSDLIEVREIEVAQVLVEGQHVVDENL